jgi:pimeloyl-ACP methyl ester carboxylesterase
MRTGQMMRLGVGLLDDVEKNTDRLDIGRAVARLARPLLILHGDQDLSVSIDNGERLAALADPALTAFETIPRTGHTFGAVHPFAGSTDALESAIDRTATFFMKHLA